MAHHTETDAQSLAWPPGPLHDNGFWTLFVTVTSSLFTYHIGLTIALKSRPTVA